MTLCTGTQNRSRKVLASGAGEAAACVMRQAAAILLLFTALFPLGAAAQTWDETLASARREGQVFVHGGPGEAQRSALTEGFRKAYPDIKISFTGSAGRDAVPMITRERAGGIYRWDVYIGGGPSVLRGLKPSGAFAPLRPALKSPEVLDDKAWFGGLEAGWMDREKQTTMAFALTINPIVFINWDFVGKESLRSFDDLLNPEFAGKIIYDDPRVPGQGAVTSLAIVLQKGPDYLQRLLSSGNVTFTNNSRQHVEWLARGRYPIGIGTPWDQIEFFRQQGIAKNVGRGLSEQFGKQVGGPGFGTVSMMDRAPNPNAAVVYINWLLSKAGQADWAAKTANNSRRIDIPPHEPDLAPQPGVPLIVDQSEEQFENFDQVLAMAKRVISATPGAVTRERP